MEWSDAYSIMESKVIKTDVIASEDAYFMATHVPFQKLEKISGGENSGSNSEVSEEDVYQKLIYNPQNEHRLIIVRGSNGTGKSHLIRWLCARYQNDSERFDKDTEEIVFLRRLSNTLRGAIRQILDQGIVIDEDTKERLEKFVSTTRAMDPTSYKMNIYSQFLVAIGADQNEKPYTRGVRKDMRAFLQDPRVEEHMLRVGGPIDRCYNAITAPSDTVFQGEATFSEEDFDLPRAMKRNISHSGSEEAKIFLQELEEDDAVKKLVKYLNGFTPQVIQGCADISSESSKNIFTQLRRELKKQGKNLTIFIEDFTAFTGIDAELITVLASEHDGVNKDLCRVTSVIGITDAYYNQFRGNFMNRVNYQINVTESAYGTADFLVEMTARYLNAIYCDPKKIENWFNNEGANPEKLPLSGYFPAYEWDTATINGRPVTLYPFNRNAITRLYEALYDSMNVSKSHDKTPRMFLRYVIKEQMSRFFDSKEIDTWSFPSDSFIASMIALKNAAHESEIDGMTSITQQERRRVKLLLQFWGNGSANAEETSVGGIRKEFFADIELGKFAGFGGTTKPETSRNSNSQPNTGEDGNESGPTEEPSTDPDVPTISKSDKQSKQLQSRLDDINTWFSKNEQLRYSADHRKWVKDFIEEAIAWPSEGVSAYIAGGKLRDSSAVFIEGQKETTSEDRAIITLGRNNEDKTFLIGLAYHHYAKSWGFPSGVYFQLKVINWLETHKDGIIAKVMQLQDGKVSYPYEEWCIAIEYIRAALMGIDISTGQKIELYEQLLTEKEIPSKVNHVGNDDWNSCLEYLKSHNSEYNDSHTLLKESLRTFMGTKVTSSQNQVGMFRGAVIEDAVNRFEAHNLDAAYLITELPENVSGITRPAKLLKELYGKLGRIASTEDTRARKAAERIERLVGNTVDKTAISKLITAIQNFFSSMNEDHKPIDHNLVMMFGQTADSSETARKIVELYESIQNALSEEVTTKKLRIYAKNPISELEKYTSALETIEKMAISYKKAAEAEIKNCEGGENIQEYSQKALDSLKKAVETLKELEVQHAQ